MMNQKMKNTNSTKPTPMHSLSESSESSELLPELDMIPEVIPAIGRTLMFEPPVPYELVERRVVELLEL